MGVCLIMGLQQGLPILLLSSLLLLLPSLHCGPQYSGKKYTDLDDGTLSDIFGSSLDSARYGGDDDDDWIEVPVSLLPGDGDCAPLQQPRKEPQMMKLHEEFRQIEVIKATGNNKCDFYQETEGFECVPYYQCDDGTIITDGFGLIDIRFGGSDAAEPELAVLDSTDLMCPGSLDVCCKDPDFVRSTSAPFTQQEAEPEPESSEESKEDLTQGKVEPLVQIQQEDASSEEEDDVVVIEPEPYVNEPEPFKSRCGRRNSYGLGVRIHNYQDDEAQFGEWPHMCAILRREIVSGGGDDGYSQQQQQVEEEVMVFQAGGSLIGAGVVLHPEFNKGNLVNTVALLFL